MTPPTPSLVASLTPSHPPDYPDVDKRTCQLLGPTALAVQALMGMGVIATLLYKRQREKPRRKWRVWVFDVSKQVIGQIIVHLSNIGISNWLSHIRVRNPCVTYLLNILVDTTIGVCLLYILLWASTKVLSEYLKLPGFKSGEYGDGPKPSLAYWGRQVAVYVACLLLMKLAVIGLFAAWPYIFVIGEWLLSWTGNSNWVQVIVVMGLCPILLNMLQFWLIDSIVKASGSLSLSNAHSPPADETQEQLLTESEGEDGPSRRRHQGPPPDGEGGHTSPIKRTATSAATAAKLDEWERNALGALGRSGTSTEQPGARRRSPPPSPHYGATGASATAWRG